MLQTVFSDYHEKLLHIGTIYKQSSSTRKQSNYDIDGTCNDRSVLSNPQVLLNTQ